MRKKTIQFFTQEYLERCKKMTPDQILKFIEDFRHLLATQKEKSILISMKVDPDLLKAFKAKSAKKDIPYQTQIKRLMQQWLNEA